MHIEICRNSSSILEWHKMIYKLCTEHEITINHLKIKIKSQLQNILKQPETEKCDQKHYQNEITTFTRRIKKPVCTHILSHIVLNVEYQLTASITSRTFYYTKIKFLILIFSLFLKYLAKEIFLIFLIRNSMYKKVVYIRAENINFVSSICDVTYFKHINLRRPLAPCLGEIDSMRPLSLCTKFNFK